MKKQRYKLITISIKKTQKNTIHL